MGSLRVLLIGVKDGFKEAQNLDYVLMPESVSRIIFASWREKIKDTYGKPIF